MDMEEFYEKACDFCSYIENTPITLETIGVLMEKLMGLYVSGLHLPDAEPESIEDKSEVDFPKAPIKIAVPDYYQEVFDPFNDDEIVGCSIYDDLWDIRADLVEGIEEYEAGYKGNAVFEWTLGLDEHWGKHATDVLRALHSIRVRGR